MLERDFPDRIIKTKNSGERGASLKDNRGDEDMDLRH